MEQAADFYYDSSQQRWCAVGDWRITAIHRLASRLRRGCPRLGERVARLDSRFRGNDNVEPRGDSVATQEGAVVHIDGSQLSHLDTSGAWLLQQLLNRFTTANVQLSGFNEHQSALLELIREHPFASPAAPKPWRMLARLGYHAVEKYQQFYDFLTFIGDMCVTILSRFRYPHEIQWQTIAQTIERTGYRALPLVGFLSFLIGVVLTYQMGLQLKTYGANIYIVDLLGLSILREFGPLMTAILLAGRTASAFTAELGTMVLNQEIDALRTLGIRPASRLILPRISSLIIVMPLLTCWSDIFGILGGMLMSKNMLHISFYEFIQRFQTHVGIENYIIGIAKAPVFGAIIAGVGCFQGFQVTGSADSVGKKTTVSVVQSIFLIIIADAIFSIFFTIRGI